MSGRQASVGGLTGNTLRSLHRLSLIGCRSLRSGKRFGSDIWTFLILRCKIRSFWNFITRRSNWVVMPCRMTVVAVLALALGPAHSTCLKTFTIFLLTLRLLTAASRWQSRGVVGLCNTRSWCTCVLLRFKRCPQIDVFYCVHTVSASAFEWVTCQAVLQAVTVALRATIVVTITLYLTIFF